MSRFRFHAAAFSASAIALGLSPQAMAEAVAFTDSRHPLTSAGGVRVVELDMPLRIEATLSKGLPPDPAKAAALAKERLANNPAIHQQLAVAYQGVLDAYSLGVTKIPAVVVDRRYVVYGERDVGTALALIDAYRSGGR